MRKLAVIGASYLQKPLIDKAKQMGIQTHVFAWAAGDAGEKAADFFYPVSIRQKDDILDLCMKIGIDGVCSIASDLAAATVNDIAYKMGLTGNSPECSFMSTNKYAMRECFAKNGDPSPRYACAASVQEIPAQIWSYPLIVKPVDRSGSRGVAKVCGKDELERAVRMAQTVSFDGHVIIEEFVHGQEYSVESISWKGEHRILAVTKKYTTGSPHFVETAHLEPADIDAALYTHIKTVVFHALDSLQIKYGASHTELKIDGQGKIMLIEIGARMGGDLIGSSLVELSTGIDYVRAVIQTALGEKPELERGKEGRAAAVRYILSEKDMEAFHQIKTEHPEYVVKERLFHKPGKEAADSSQRYGWCLLCADTADDITPYLPDEKK